MDVCHPSKGARKKWQSASIQSIQFILLTSFHRHQQNKKRNRKPTQSVTQKENKRYTMGREENTSLANACMEGNSETVIGLLEGNPEMAQTCLTWRDSDGKELSCPPIFIAIDYGHLQMIEKLLPYYKNTIDTIMDEDGDYTALQWASWTGNLDVVNLLIDQGKAKPDEEALSLAREFNHDQVAEILAKHVDLYSALQGDDDAIMDKACREGDTTMVKELLEQKEYDLDKWKDEGGKYLALSPMYMALKFGHMEIVQLFAEKGVQVDLEE